MKMPRETLRGIGLAGVMLAAVLWGSGCGGEGKKFVGTWRLDLGRAGETAEMEGFSLTMAFNDDGTGTLTSTQAFSADMPGSTSGPFTWEIQDGEIEISFSEGEMSMTQKMKYEFDEEGALTLTSGRQPAMKYRRVE
jgi:hypothetical protein